MIVGAHLGVVSVVGRVESECWRGTYENGTHESQTWTAAGVTFETPLGPYGPGVAWVSSSTADGENTREDCRMFISYVGNVGCPAGQPAPFIAPALP